MKRLVSLLLVAMLMGAVLVPSAVAAPLAQTQTVHVVQPGENLFRISLRYGVTVAAIQAANGLTDHIVYVGQQLTIPAAGIGTEPSQPAAPVGALYTVRPGDTLSGIALRYGVTSWALVQANNLASANLIYVGQQLIIPGSGTPINNAPGQSTYTVQPGDTLSSIAARFGSTPQALAAYNGIANPSLIYVGQVLRLTGNAINPAPSAGGAKHIYIYISQQHLYAYEGDRLVYSFVASTGRAPTYTRTGEFRVQSKVPNAWGSTWSIWMPHWLGIYWAGGLENGIHALPVTPGGQTLWAGYLGTPISFGCIVLGTYEALQLYNWAEIGTPVTIRY